MIDGVVLAGYLAVAATRTTGRVFDEDVDALLDRLSKRVEERLGGRAVADVELHPGDTDRRLRLGRGIDAVARTDPQLAREFVSLQDELDRKVGRQLIDALLPATIPTTDDATPDAVTPSIVDGPTAPRWIRALVVAGVLVCLVGFAMALVGLIGVIGSMSTALGKDPAPGDTPTLGTALPGFGVFFVGVAIIVAGNVGRAVAQRR